MKKPPLVSICMITYGHENFIEQAINGVLMQECDFEIELIIANDCSPDNVNDIIQNIIQNNPRGSIIKYFKHVKNIGMMPNFIFALQHCKGKYIALCEGDDYWTDPLKLQKQVNFLEANPDYIIHSGNAFILTENPESNGKTVFNSEINITFHLEDFLANNNLVTCTVMFRNIDCKFPPSYRKVTFGDWFLYIILLKKSGGKAYRDNASFSVYRIHTCGVMSKLNTVNYLDAHIIQIISIYKFLVSTSVELKVIKILNGYSLQKYRLVLKDQKYFEALKTVVINFRYCKLNMPSRKYLSDFKQHFIYHKT